MNQKKKILFFNNVDWFFISHRLHIANFLSKKGFEVHLATNFTESVNKFDKEIILHHIKFSRNRINFLSLIKDFISIVSLIKKIKPDITHFITLRIVLIGAFATFLNNDIKKFFSIAGMGITNNLTKKKISYFITLRLLKYLLKKNNNNVIVQNTSDFQIFSQVISSPSRIRLIEGSGVNIDDYFYQKINFNKKILMATRLLKSKGVYDYCEIAKNAKLNHLDLNFNLAGMLDTSNPDCINLNFLQKNYFDKYVKYLGYEKKINDIIFDYDIIILLSTYGEGLPKIVLEAMSSGRIVIGLNNPGINQIIDNNINGFIVEKKDLLNLHLFIDNLFQDENLLLNIGKNAREKILKKYTLRHIQQEHLNFYLK